MPPPPPPPAFSQAWPWNWFHFSAVKWRHGYCFQAWTSDFLAASSVFSLLLAGDCPSLWGSFCSFVSTANIALTDIGANRMFSVQTRFWMWSMLHTGQNYILESLIVVSGLLCFKKKVTRDMRHWVKFWSNGWRMRGSVLFLGLPPTGFGFPAKENDSMDAKIAHPRGKKT